MNFFEACSHFQLVSGRLYYLMVDGILRLVPNPTDYPNIVQEAHVSFTSQHRSKQGTIFRILCNGYWWPTMQFHVATFVAKVCKECRYTHCIRMPLSTKPCLFQDGLRRLLHVSNQERLRRTSLCTKRGR